MSNDPREHPILVAFFIFGFIAAVFINLPEPDFYSIIRMKIVISLLVGLIGSLFGYVIFGKT